MKRTKLADRVLPDYTRGEEIFNMTSHIIGGALGVAALVLCLVQSVIHEDVWAIVSSAIYGASLILLYVMSSVYHGLTHIKAKKVMQVLDHCTIYLLIGGTYTPVVLCALRKISPAWAWSIFGVVWGFAVIATVFTAIDLQKYAKFSMACYIGMGWCIIIAARPTLQAIALRGMAFLIAGGIAYTVGAIIYSIGKKRRYMHSVFHVFVVLGSILQFFCIYQSVI